MNQEYQIHVVCMAFLQPFECHIRLRPSIRVNEAPENCVSSLKHVCCVARDWTELPINYADPLEISSFARVWGSRTSWNIQPRNALLTSEWWQLLGESCTACAMGENFSMHSLLSGRVCIILIRTSGVVAARKSRARAKSGARHCGNSQTDFNLLICRRSRRHLWAAYK